MRQAQLVCMRLDPAQCDLHALLENVAKFSCQLHAATPGHVRNLDEKYATVAARAVGHEASHDSWATISCQQVLRGKLPENSTSLGAPARQKGPQGERSAQRTSAADIPGLLCDLLIILFYSEDLFYVLYGQLRLVVLHVPAVFSFGVLDSLRATYRANFTL